MDKLLGILSGLQIKSEYISREVSEIKFLSNKNSETVNKHQQRTSEILRISQEIEALKQDEQSLYEKLKDREKEFAMLIEKLEEQQRKYENLVKSEEKTFVTSQLENLKNSESKMKLFGINIESQFLEPALYQSRVIFPGEHFVILNYDMIQNTYELQSLQPFHNNFTEMRTFLSETGDIVGFLCNIRKFFEKTNSINFNVR